MQWIITLELVQYSSGLVRDSKNHFSFEAEVFTHFQMDILLQNIFPIFLELHHGSFHRLFVILTY